MKTLMMLALLSVVGCAAAGTPSPREIRAGEDSCEYCHMSVDDPSRAAQWVAGGGGVRMFDEPGCLVAWLQRSPGVDGRAFFADASDGGWVAAEAAVFVRGAARTGMGFNILAYRDPAMARDAGGEILSWQQLLEEGVQDAHAH